MEFEFKRAEIFVGSCFPFNIDGISDFNRASVAGRVCAVKKTGAAAVLFREYGDNRAVFRVTAGGEYYSLILPLFHAY